MKKITPILTILIVSIFVFSGLAVAGTETQQLLKNASFDSGETDWSYYYHDELYGHAKWKVSFHNSEADIQTTLSVGAVNEEKDYSYAYIYQTLTLPKLNATNITSATLSIRYSVNLYSPKDVSLIYGIVSGNSWVIEKSVSFPHVSQYTTSWEVLTQDITNFTKQNLGDTIQVRAEIQVSSWGWLSAYSHLYVDWIYLNITQKTSSSSGGSGGGGWWGGGSGWSGGGGSWSGGGGAWSGGGSSWHGGGGFFGILGGWFGHTGAVNQTYVEYEVERMQEVLSIIGGITISILWVKVAVNYFSGDPEKRKKAKEQSLNAFVGTIIVAIAVLGAMWIITGWLVGAW